MSYYQDQKELMVIEKEDDFYSEDSNSDKVNLSENFYEDKEKHIQPHSHINTIDQYQSSFPQTD